MTFGSILQTATRLVLCRLTSESSTGKVIKKLINQNKVSAEDQEQTKQISSGSLSSVLSEMQKIITEFKDGMPDYIDKIVNEKLPANTQPYDQKDRVSLLPFVDRKFDHEVQHVPATLEQNGVGVIDSPINITRDKVYFRLIIFLQISFCFIFYLLTVMLDKRFVYSFRSCLFPVEWGNKRFEDWWGVKKF